MDTEGWKSLWIESHAGSFLEGRRSREKEWSGFWDGKSEKYLENVKKSEKFYRDILRHLKGEGHFRQGDRVLDIACGPGTYSLLFAESAKAVTSLDLSRGMLATLSGEAARRRLQNIATIESPWEKYDGHEKFDLVFTALSPAISGPDMLMKMEASSRRSCCYVSFGDDSFTGLRNEIWSLVTGEERRPGGFSIAMPFGLLTSMGRRPEVKYFNNIAMEPRSTEQVVTEHIEFLKTFVEIDGEKERMVRDYVRAKDESGRLQLKGGRLLVAMCWNVPSGAA